MKQMISIAITIIIVTAKGLLKIALITECFNISVKDTAKIRPNHNDRLPLYIKINIIFV